MQPNTLTTRGVTFAYLFGPPRTVTRQEATDVHNAICTELGYDDLSFRYEPRSSARGPQGFRIQIARKEGRGGFNIVAEFAPTETEAIRLLIQYDWPQSIPHVVETADKTADAVLQTLTGSWQTILAEVRWRAHCAVHDGNAVEFIRQHLCKINDHALQNLGGPISFAQIRIDTDEQAHGGDPLAHPKREITIEVLRDDRRYTYIELMSQWRQLPPQTSPTLNLAELVPDRLRSFDTKPSQYINDAEEFLKNNVLPLGATG